MSGGYDVVIAHPSSSRPRRVVYRETSSPHGGSWEVNVYTRRASERIIYTRNDRDYELYSSSYRRRVYYY